MATSHARPMAVDRKFMCVDDIGEAGRMMVSVLDWKNDGSSVLPPVLPYTESFFFIYTHFGHGVIRRLHEVF